MTISILIQALNNHSHVTNLSYGNTRSVNLVRRDLDIIAQSLHSRTARR